MGGMGLIVLVRRLLSPPVLSGPMTNTSWTHSYSKQSHIRKPVCRDLPLLGRMANFAAGVICLHM